jgi:alkylhydroperoxidase/carboxymuconolactone decarboxylase family protein YurZ
MTPDGEKALEEVRQVRGYALPVHELMAEVSGELLRRYNALSSWLIFQSEEGGLDHKTKALVFLAIATATKGDREGIELGIQRALKAGATEREVLETICLVGLPAGIPAVEYAGRVWREFKEGGSWLKVPEGYQEMPE